MEAERKRWAVLVGCNYPNTSNELHGCYNDVFSMRELLIQRFGFDPSRIEVLTDKPGSLVMATGANIKKALQGMVDKANPGDVLFFHYSGHGSLIQVKTPGHFMTKTEEVIVPSDLNVITNLDFRNIVNRLPEGATLTILADSCHSGGLIDKETQQIGPCPDHHNPLKTNISMNQKLKRIPFESILQHLKSLTGKGTLEIGIHLLELFGDEASLRFRLSDEEQQELHRRNKEDDNGILLSGCQANETSADVPARNGGIAHGAFTNAVQMVLEKNVSPLSNRELVLQTRMVLESQDLGRQHPCLYCSDRNADALFLCQDHNDCA